MFRIIILIVLSALYVSKKAHANIEAMYIDNSVQIKWTYVEQKRLSHFIIEKSKNGKDFKTFSKIYSGKSYSSFIETDHTPYRDISFYRIRYMNTDGTSCYSETVSIRKIYKFKHLPLKLKGTTTLNTLVVLKDKSNKEFYAKLNIQEENGILISETMNEILKNGNFIIVASENDDLVGNTLKIINRNSSYLSVDTLNKISR